MINPITKIHSLNKDLCWNILMLIQYFLFDDCLADKVHCHSLEMDQEAWSSGTISSVSSKAFSATVS